MAWAGGSRDPVVFKPWGGLNNAVEDLVNELRFMLTTSEFVSEAVHMSHQHMTRAEAGLVADLESYVEAAEARSEDLAAVEFVAEHAVEHLVIHSLQLGLTALSSAALHSGLVTAAFALEGTAVGVHILGAVLSHPIVLGFTAVRTAHELVNHFREKDAHARSFAVGLVAKSDCIANKVTLDRLAVLDENNHIRDPSFFVPEFAEVCGADLRDQLADQMIKTNTALRDLFNEFKGIGKCVYPEGPRSWSKSNCVHSIYEPLREYEGESGILFSAFAFAAAYGQESDELLGKPVYSEWFERYFNISMPHAEDAHNELQRLANSAATVQEKMTACITIVGLHRAFERLFVRLKTALKVYMHTFARDRLHVSTRTIQHPCRRVFREFEDRALGLCKDGTDLPLMVPDTLWLQDHAQHMSDTMLENVGQCIEDSHPELVFALSLSTSGPEDGENAEEEEHSQDEY